MTLLLETPRLLVRELASGDLDFVAAMLAHPEVMRYWPRTYARQEAAEWIERHQERYRTVGYGYWLALDKTSGQPIGQVGLLQQRVDGAEHTGLGYVIHRPFWRQGYAGEGGAACLEHGFRVLGKQRIIALIRPENTPSQGVAARLGMAVAGRTWYADFEHLIYEAWAPAGSH